MFVEKFLADFGQIQTTEADVAAAESFAVATEVLELVADGKSFQEAIEEFSAESSLESHEIATIVETELGKLGIAPTERETLGATLAVCAAVAAQQAILADR